MMVSVFDKGLDRVIAEVADAVEWTFSDADEIGSSDVSCCVRDVIKSLTGVDIFKDRDAISPVEISMVRNAVNNQISEVLA